MYPSGETAICNTLRVVQKYTAENLTVAPPFSVNATCQFHFLGMLLNGLCRSAGVISALAACNAPQNPSKVYAAAVFRTSSTSLPKH